MTIFASFKYLRVSPAAARLPAPGLGLKKQQSISRTELLRRVPVGAGPLLPARSMGNHAGQRWHGAAKLSSTAWLLVVLPTHFLL